MAYVVHQLSSSPKLPFSVNRRLEPDENWIYLYLLTFSLADNVAASHFLSSLTKKVSFSSAHMKKDSRDYLMSIEIIKELLRKIDTFHLKTDRTYILFLIYSCLILAMWTRLM